MSHPTKIGKYDILEPLGRGGVGTVYKGYQSDLDRHVAIKVMIAGEHASEELIRRFLREARAAASLVHSGVVQIHDVGSEGSLHHIVMEWVPGGSLSEKLVSGPLGPREALRICAEVAESLSEAHERGIVHRDIKPSNILLDAKGRPKIADFGLAVSLEEDERLTRTGDILGTPCYMSPEQAFASPEEVDARTDIYSLGAVLYELLTGRPPFEAPNAFSILKRIELEDPAPPSSRRKDLGMGLDSLVLKSLEKTPARRYASMGEFAEALRNALESERPPSAPQKPARRGQVAWIAALALSASLLAFAAGRTFTKPDASNGGAAEVDGAAASLSRLYAAFVRKAIIEGNARIPCLSAPLPFDPAEEVRRMRAQGASPTQMAMAESIQLGFEGKLREAEVLRRYAIQDGAATRLPAAFLGALEAARVGNEREALRIADAWMDRPTLEAFLCRAVVLEHLGRYERLQESLRIARSLDPQDPFPVLYALGVAICCQNDLEADPGRVAGEILEQVDPLLRRDPKPPGPRLLLGIAHLVQGNRKLAQESFAAAHAGAGAVVVAPNLKPTHLKELLAAAGASETRFLLESGRFLMQYRLAGAEAALRESIERSAKEEKTIGRDIRRAAHLLLAEMNLAANPSEAILHLRASVDDGLDLDMLHKDPRFAAFLDDSRNAKALNNRDPGSTDPKRPIKDGDRGKKDGDGGKSVPKQ